MSARPPGWGGSEHGSAVVEFTLVIALLTLLTLSVLQLALALHIRNTLLDAAAEGARFGTLGDSSPERGIERARDLITVALGAGYATTITAETGDYLGYPSLTVTVSAPLPLIGLVGVGDSLEVSGHAVEEIAP